MQLPPNIRAEVRPIRPGDEGWLRKGLTRLSPEGQFQRFLQPRQDFTAQELYYLTHCDMVDHIAMLLVLVDAAGVEFDAIGVARSVRQSDEPDLAEVAIVLVDEWQRHGGGTLLLKTLAAEAWRQGVRRWYALVLQNNSGVEHLLGKVGTKTTERRLGNGLMELTFLLNHPT